MTNERSNGTAGIDAVVAAGVDVHGGVAQQLIDRGSGQF